MATDNGVLTLFRANLEKHKDKMREVAPSSVAKLGGVERISRLAIHAVAKNPALLDCEPVSLLQAVLVAARLGLEPDGTLGEGYLVPYGKTATFVPGYRGLINLARRSGMVLSIEAHLVHELDEFVVVQGSHPKLRHVPALVTERGPVVAAYALARLRGAQRGDPEVVQWEVMTLEDLEHVKRSSRASSSGPWKSHEGEMQRKTVVRRLCKYLPVSVELAAAMTLQAGAEKGESFQEAAGVDLGVLEPRPVTVQREEAPAPSSASPDELRARKRGRPPKEAPSAPPSPAPAPPTVAKTPETKAAEAKPQESVTPPVGISGFPDLVVRLGTENEALCHAIWDCTDDDREPGIVRSVHEVAKKLHGEKSVALVALLAGKPDPFDLTIRELLAWVEKWPPAFSSKTAS